LKQASEYENEKQKSEEFLVAKEKLEELNYVLDNIDYLYGIYDSIDFPWATNGSTVRATLDRYINDTTLFKLIDSKSKGATF
jgi:hypothetical protein